MAGSIIVGIAFEILSSIGLCLTTLFLITLIRCGYLKSDVPFSIIFNLSASYFCHLCIVVFHNAPEVILGHDPFSEELERAAKFFYLCFWYVTLFSQILMTFNRYVAVCQFQIYPQLLSIFRVRLLCFLSWVIGLLVAVIPECGVCCPLVFGTHIVRSLRVKGQNGTYELESSHEAESSHEIEVGEVELTNYQTQTNWMLVATHVVNFVTFLTMICLYILVLIKVKKVHSEVEPDKDKAFKTHTAVKVMTSNAEMSIAANDDGHSSRASAASHVQYFSQQQQQQQQNQQSRILKISFQAFTLSFCFSVFCMFQVLVQFLFTTVPMMLILQLSHMINCSVVPVVFLVLNPKVREEMLGTVACCKNQKPTQGGSQRGNKSGGNGGPNRQQNIFVRKAESRL